MTPPTPSTSPTPSATSFALAPQSSPVLSPSSLWGASDGGSSKKNKSSCVDISNASSQVAFCRICHDGAREERLVSPCKCSGSVALVHKSCMEKWLQINQATKQPECELCRFAFQVELTPQPVWKWLLGRPCSDDQRALSGDIVCFLLLTPLALISAYLCLVGATMALERSASAEATGLVLLALFLALVYVVWIFVTVRYHFSAWRSWRKHNQKLRLIQELWDLSATKHPHP